MIIRWPTLVVLLIFFIAACEGQRGKSILMPKSSEKELIKLGYLDERSIGGYWQPTKAEIDTLEHKLPEISKLRSEGPLLGMQIAEPGKDNRQYVPVMINRRKFVLVNAFCIPPSSDWTTRLIVVFDGGTCVWRVLYDVETQTFSHLTTNGRA